MTKLLVALLLAHSFYDQMCCSDKDCHPTVAVTEAQDGYHYKQHVIPYKDYRVRESPDGRFHVCETSYDMVLCIYVPMRMS